MLEERLDGREVSAFALVSGEAVVPLAAACDYKRLGDATAARTPAAWGVQPRAVVRLGELEALVAEVFEPVAWRLARDGTPYRGVLYAGMILTAGGPMVLEFNARFGDPEAQVVLPFLDGELANALPGPAAIEA